MVVSRQVIKAERPGGRQFDFEDLIGDIALDIAAVKSDGIGDEPGQIDGTETAAPALCVRGLLLQALIGIQPRFSKPVVGPRGPFKTLQASVNLFQKFPCGLIGAFIFFGLAEIEKMTVILEEARIFVQQAFQKPFGDGVAGSDGSQGVGNEGKKRPLALVFPDQAQEYPFLKGTVEIEIPDDGIVILPIPVDAAVALFQAIGLKGSSKWMS